MLNLLFSLPVKIPQAGDIGNESAQIPTVAGHEMSAGAAAVFQIAYVPPGGIVNREPVDPAVRQDRLFPAAV